MKVLKLVLLVALPGIFSACTDLYLMGEYHEQTADGWISAGASCNIIENNQKSGSSVMKEPDPAETQSDFLLATKTYDDSAVVTVTSQGQQLLKKQFNEKFMESGDREELKIVTGNNVTYRLRFWGGETCEEKEE